MGRSSRRDQDSAVKTNPRSVSDLDLAHAYNDIDHLPSLEAVASSLGISAKTLANRVGVLRRTEGAPELIDRANFTREEDQVLSEKPALFMEHWGPDECMEHFRKLAKADPERSWSRNYFRNVSGISESTWNRWFGTFLQYQRSSKIILSRDAHMLERHIAKHASKDHVEPFNDEKRSYSGKYARDFTNRFRTVIVGSDFHDKDCDGFVRRVFIDTCRRIQPEVIFLNGDMLDLPEFGKYTIDPRTWDVTGRIGWMHAFLRELRTACPNSRIIYLEGNHEFRILRHLAEATPALKTILADLHGFTVSKLLGLDEFEINYIGKADLRAWHNKDINKELHANTYLLWDALLGDHFPTGIEQGIPGWNGHHHKLRVTPLYSRVFGASQWVQLPGGHVPNAEYCSAEKWNNGFLIVHHDSFTKRSTFEPIEMRDFCVVGGKYYYRQADETFYKGQTSFDMKLAA